MIDEDLRGLSITDIMRLLEAGKIGHQTAMDALQLDTYHDLVRVMHNNGRTMPGHQPMIVHPETRALLKRITKPLAQRQ
jgi:hypothetical protein